MLVNVTCASQEARKITFSTSKIKLTNWRKLQKALSKAILSGIALCLDSSEAVTQACSVKKLFLEISQNSQESTCVRVSILIKLQA